MVTTVTITKHFQANGNSNGRAWTRNDFRTDDGGKFQTYDGDVASQVKALMNQPVEIEYTVKENGQYVNNEIVSVRALNGAAPTPAPVQANGQPTTPADDRQVMINRSAGLARAIEFCSVAGISVAEELDSGGLFMLSDTFARYFETGEFGAASPSSAAAVEESAA